MKNKYLGVVVIGIVMLFLVGTVNAFSTEEDTWWTDFLKNLFSSLGQQAGCETYPDDSGTFNSPKTISCTGGEFPGTEECLINVFHADYAGTQPAFECGNYDVEGEVNSCLEYIVITGSRTISPLGPNSIYELYNCPIGSLLDGDNQIGDCDCDYGATSSSCDSLDTCGVNKPKCMEQGGDDICVTTGQYAIECPNGLDGSSQECECDSNYIDDTWKNQRCPSIEPYCVDNSVMETTYDACSTSPTGIGIEKCSEQNGKICSGGQTCSTGIADASDTNYCCLGTCEDEDVPTNGDVDCVSQGGICRGNQQACYEKGEEMISTTFNRMGCGFTLLLPNVCCKETSEEGNRDLGIGNICTKDTDCETLHCDKSHWYSLKNTCQPIPWDEVKKVAVSKNEIKEMTTQDKMALLCTSDVECIVTDTEKYKADCIPLSNLREDGIITEGKKEFVDYMDGFFYGTLGGGIAGGAIGGGLCVAGGAILGFVFPPSIPAILAAGPTICAGTTILGAGIGTYEGVKAGISMDKKSELAKAIDAEDDDAAGLCVQQLKSSGLEFLEWAAWFDITGDGTKDGTDGLIIVIILASFLLVMLKR